MKIRELAIVVPYGNREEHLRHFLPHMDAYFQRDKIDRNIPCHIHVIEQTGTEPFNRGKLLNVGFEITKFEADHFAFHDVDYLPIWADYSFPEQPIQLVYYGTVTTEPEDFFGAAVLFREEHFELINGFSNEYWGWGGEDLDLRQRCIEKDLKPTRRKGTHTALPHEHQGFYPNGTMKEEEVINRKRYKRKLEIKDYDDDGLSNLDYKLLEEVTLTMNATLFKIDIRRPEND